MFDFRDSFEEGNLSKWSLVDTSIAISALQAFRGVNSARVNGTTTTGFVRYDLTSANYTTPGYQRVYFRIASATIGGTPVQILRFSDVTNTHVGSIRIDSSLQLGLYNAANAQIGLSTAALNTNQWYCIELKITAPSNPGTLEARLDGVVFASGNNSSQGSWGRVLLGVITPAATIDFYYDEYAFSSVDYPGLIPDTGSKDIPLNQGGSGKDISLSFVGSPSLTASVFDTVAIAETRLETVALGNLSTTYEDFNTSTSGIFTEYNGLSGTFAYTEKKAHLSLTDLADFESVGIKEGSMYGNDRGRDFSSGEFIFQVTDIDVAAAGEFYITGDINVSGGSDNTTLLEVYMGVFKSTINGYTKLIIGNTNGSFASVFDYDPALHRWFRIRHSGADWQFGHSPDRNTWTDFVTTLPKVANSLNCVEVALQISNDGGATGTVSAKFDDFNTPAMERAESIVVTENITVQLVDSDLTVNTFDAVGITENTTSELNNFASVFDAIGIVENTTLELTQITSVFDDFFVTEDVVSSIVLEASVFDAIGITEAVTSELVHNNDVFDSVGIVEVTTLELNQFANVFDVLTPTEDVVASIVLEASVFDLITIEDIPLYYPDHIYIEEDVVVVLVLPALEISVFDAVGITETTIFEITIAADVFDAVGITEVLTLELNQFVSLFDSIGIAEQVIIETVSLISVFDAISITESVTVEPASNINTFDSIGITESNTLELNNFANLFDAVGIAEDVSASVLVAFDINVFDLVGIVDRQTTTTAAINGCELLDETGVPILGEDGIPLYIDGCLNGVSLSDTIGITEVITTLISATASVSDTATITEFVTIAVGFDQSVFDQLTIAEIVTSDVTINLSIFDAIGIIEDVSITGLNNLELSVFDAISITETVVVEVTASQSVFDAVSIAENVTTVFEGEIFTISAFDIIAIEEFITSETTTSLNLQDLITITENVNPNQIFDAQLLFDSIVFSESINAETIRFSPEPPKYRPRGKQHRLILRGDSPTARSGGSAEQIIGAGSIQSR